jgi:glycosyltransferase involved in cell wall biosynthesis
LDDLVAALRDLFADSETYRRMSSAATAYYSEHHTVEAVCGRFRRAFERLLDNAGRNNHD